MAHPVSLHCASSMRDNLLNKSAAVQFYTTYVALSNKKHRQTASITRVIRFHGNRIGDTWSYTGLFASEPLLSLMLLPMLLLRMTMVAAAAWTGTQLICRPKCHLSSAQNHAFRAKFSSKILIPVQVSSSHWKVFNLQTDKYVLNSKSVKRSGAFLYITINLFNWKCFEHSLNFHD